MENTRAVLIKKTSLHPDYLFDGARLCRRVFYVVAGASLNLARLLV